MPSGGQACRYLSVTSAAERSRGLPRRPPALHADLRDPPSVDAGDLEAIALDLDRVADRREPPQAAENHPTDGVVGLVGQLEVEPLAQVLERGEAVDQIRPRRFLAERGRVAVELVLHLADELLDDVFEGHEPRRPAKLVQDDRRLDALP